MFTLLKLYVCLKMKIKPNNYMTNEESSAKAHEIHHPTKLQASQLARLEQFLSYTIY